MSNALNFPSDNHKKYDLIFSLGAACSCAQTLIEANLRQFSSPFDWLYGSNFLNRTKILVSNFKDFINQKDLTKCNFTNGDKNNLCDVYKNEYNSLVFNHDFPTEIPLEKSYNSVKRKYQRRIERLLQKIQQAKSVLIVYIEISDHKDDVSDNDITAGWSEIQQKYPDKKIDLLYFVNDNQMEPKQLIKLFLSPNITKIVSNYKSQGKDTPSYAVDISFLSHQLSEYRLNLPFSHRVKKISLKFIINCIPFKILRKKLRRKYHV